MTVDQVLIIVAGVLGVAAALDRDARWAGLGVVLLAVALLF